MFMTPVGGGRTRQTFNTSLTHTHTRGETANDMAVPDSELVYEQTEGSLHKQQLCKEQF